MHLHVKLNIHFIILKMYFIYKGFSKSVYNKGFNQVQCGTDVWSQEKLLLMPKPKFAPGYCCTQIG